MSKRNILPAVFICCIYVQTIQCLDNPPCYIQPAESCPPQNKCRCVKTDDSSLFCCEVQSTEDLLKNFECSGAKLLSIKALHIYNMTADNFNFGKLSPELCNLISFAITNSYINRVLGRLDHTHQITCLNVSNNVFGAEWQEPFALENLKVLTNLDFSNVNITSLPVLKIQVPIFWINISNSTKVKCDSIVDLMTKSRIASSYKLVFINSNQTFCASSLSFHWFNSTEKVTLSQVKIIDQLNEDCPKKCNCNWYGYDMIQDTNPLYTVKVDCSNQGLSYLPEKLPKNTVQLNITNNSITNIDALAKDQTYKTLRFFWADENKISSILPLEGSPFIEHYAVLSLKFNQLKNLPSYILQNSFTREFEGHIVNLGGNELQCDCSTAQTLKGWLLTNRVHIPDADDILCENVHNKLKVVELDQKLVCIAETNWTYYMYYIIVAEFSALVLLIGKVSYDYWVFKTAGYLPWPASKMPKLPCDWIFE